MSLMEYIKREPASAILRMSLLLTVNDLILDEAKDSTGEDSESNKIGKLAKKYPKAGQIDFKM